VLTGSAYQLHDAAGGCVPASDGLLDAEVSLAVMLACAFERAHPAREELLGSRFYYQKNK